MGLHDRTKPTQNQIFLESFYESFSALIVPILLLAAGVGFLLLVFDEETVLLMKYNQFRMTQATDEQCNRYECRGARAESREIKMPNQRCGHSAQRNILTMKGFVFIGKIQ